MQQDKQGTQLNTISQRTANEFIPETLTLSCELAIAFLEIVHVQISILYLTEVPRQRSRSNLCRVARHTPQKSSGSAGQTLTCVLIGIEWFQCSDG